MDMLLAEKYRRIFVNKTIDAYTIEKLINCGKSAAVFLADSGDGHKVAVKIFDTELISKYGADVQEQRIEREVSLKGHSITGLVQIFGGGTIIIDTVMYYYIIMEYIEGENLKQYISRNNPCDEIFAKKVFACLSSVCNELLSLDIAHRDIKPENIMLTSKDEIILMDLGVLKIIGNIDLTDVNGHTPFIATLKYAPPELLLRNEVDTVDGWKAINIYQIAATLHDVLMGYEIFNQCEEPYGKLVMAVINEKPRIERSDYSQDFVMLIRNMLIKDWKDRLAVYNQNDVDAILSNKVTKTNEELLARLKNIKAGYKDDISEIEQLQMKSIQDRAQLEIICTTMDEIIHECFLKMQREKIINGLTTTDNPNLNRQRIKQYSIDGDLSQGFVKPVIIYIQYPNKHDVCYVNILGEIAFSEQILDGQHRFIQFYAGEFDQQLFTERITETIYKLVFKALSIMKSYVEKELEWKKRTAVTTGPHARFSSVPQNIIINDFEV